MGCAGGVKRERERENAGLKSSYELFWARTKKKRRLAKLSIGFQVLQLGIRSALQSNNTSGATFDGFLTVFTSGSECEQDQSWCSSQNSTFI